MATFTMKVLYSHLSQVPEEFNASSLKDLRAQIQTLANRAAHHSPLGYGTITFRYELDEQNRVTVVHSYFTNRHERQTRFIRLGVVD